MAGVGHRGAEASLVITPLSGGYIISTLSHLWLTLVVQYNSIQYVSQGGDWGGWWV